MYCLYHVLGVLVVCGDPLVVFGFLFVLWWHMSRHWHQRLKVARQSLLFTSLLLVSVVGGNMVLAAAAGDACFLP